jgi:branched-chain amino acid transport system substrate-binding protein
MSTSNRQRPRMLATLASLAVLALAACSAGPTSGATSGDGSQQKPIIIGGTLGLTGSNSGPSAGYLAAAEYWAEQTNASGGLLGRQVKLKIYDDESTQTTAQQLYQQLLDQDHADLILAPFTTAIGGAIAPIVRRSNKIIFNGGFVSKEVHEKFKNLASSWTYQDVEYSKAYFDMIAGLDPAQRPKTMAIVTAQSAFTLAALQGYDGSGGALNYAKAAGIDVVFNEKYDSKATSLTSLIQQAKASGADAFLALTLPNDGFLIAKTVNQVGYHPRFYCSCGAEVISLPNWKDLGAAGLNVYSTTLSSPELNSPGLAELAQHLKQTKNYDTVPAYAIAGYAALQVLGQVVKETNSLDQRKLWANLQGHTFETASGTLKYESDDGTVDFGGLLTQYQDGKGARVVWPTESADAKPVIP